MMLTHVSNGNIFGVHFLHNPVGADVFGGLVQRGKMNEECANKAF